MGDCMDKGTPNRPSRLTLFYFISAFSAKKGLTCSALQGLSFMGSPAHGEAGARAAALLIVGKCLLGQLADRFGSLRATVPFYLLVLSGYALCALAGMGSTVLAVASVLVMGVGCSVGTLCYSMFAGDMSMPEQFGATVRTYPLTSTLGGMAASFLPGLLADLTGHYMVSYVGFVAIGLASLGMICLVHRHLEKQA